MNPKARARAEGRCRFYSATMRPCDPAHRRQAKAGPALGRGEKRVENAAKIFFADASARVRNFDDRFFAAILSLSLPDFYRDAAFLFDRFDSIDNQIQNGILDLRRVRVHY